MKAFLQGRILEPESHELCAVYDPRDGRIVHVHEVVRWPGASGAATQGVETRALEIAAGLGHRTARLKTLRLEPSAFAPRKRHRIDPKTLRLVVIEGPARAPRPGASTQRKKKKAAKPTRSASRRKSAARKTAKRRGSP